ncbi:Zinc finger BED domain-containing protein RICESLEEPER 3 [Linum grandiflorum]
MAASTWAKFNKYWEVIQQIFAVAVALDPWYKLDIDEYYAEKIGLHGGCLNYDDIKTIFGDLVVQYQSKLNGNNDVDVGNDMDASSCTSEMGFDLFVSRRKKSKTSFVIVELDAYLNEDIMPRTIIEGQSVMLDAYLNEDLPIPTIMEAHFNRR